MQTDGCVVMVEDLDNEPYLVDTALNQLIRAGKLDRAAGFVFGTDVNLKPQTIPEAPESNLSIEEMLDELIAPLGIPAIANVPGRPRQAHGDDAARRDGAARRRREELGSDRGCGGPTAGPTTRRGPAMRLRSIWTRRESWRRSSH